jgi:hypothetical protein
MLQCLALLRKFLVGCVILTTLGPMQAQSLPSLPRILLRDRVAWASGDGTWCYFPANPNNSAMIVRNGIPRPFVPPQQASSSYTLGGNTLWTIAYRTGPTGKEQMRLVGQALDSVSGRWDVDAGIIDSHYGIPLQLFPTKNPKLFLGFNLLSGFVKDGKASYAACFKVSEQRIVLDHCIDMPFNSLDTIAKCSTSISELGENTNCEPIHVFLQPNLLSIIQNEANIFVASTKIGIIWIFSRKDGELSKTIQLTDTNLKDLPKTAFLDHYILGMEPMRDGDILVATREPETLEYAKKMYFDATDSSILSEKYKKEYLTLIDDYREIQWIRIDAKSLSYKRDETISPAWKFNFKALRNFYFLVDPAGDVVFNTEATWDSILTKLKIIHENQNIRKK